MWCHEDETREALGSTQGPARLFSLLLLANIYFECLIWARPWVFVLLFVLKFVLMISPVIQVRTVMVAVGPMRKQAQKPQVTCPRSQSQQAMGALLCRASLGWDPRLCRPIFSAQVQGAFPPSQSQQGYQVQECQEPPASGRFPGNVRSAVIVGPGQ